MGHEGQGGVLLSVSDVEELLGEGKRRYMIPSHSVKYPPPIQDLSDLERLAHLQTQLLRAGVGVFHFVGSIPLRRYQLSERS